MSEVHNPCPKCDSPYPYEDGTLWICPECAHEFNPQTLADEAAAKVIRDANGLELKSGDDVVVLKDLKIKGSNSKVKSGTKVKKIRLIEDAVDGHNIACRVEGLGAMDLKSEFVKKA